ncbi:MAG TPA: hypothetical protein VFX35_03070 [Solirubrobacterales bacterium]|nr:hypothetical protein [Solirubrobacterales bacterium]
MEVFSVQQRPISMPTDSVVPRSKPATAINYDAYFGLDRSGTNLRRWTMQCLLVERELLSDLPVTSLPEEARASMRLGFLILHRINARRWAEVESAPALGGEAADDWMPTRLQAPLEPLERWKLGHQVLHLYLVAMVTLMGELQAEVDVLVSEQIAMTLEDVAELFSATSAGMRYASDFDARAYGDIVRPSMAPPAMPPGFSGVLNTDHARMIESLPVTFGALARRFGEQQSAWPDAVSNGWTTLVDAQLEARRSHRFVCRRFVPDEPSLLRAFRQAGTA